MNLGIKSKLVMTLLAVNCFIAATMFYLSSKSFDEGFLDYVIQLELQKMKPFAQELSLIYQQKNDWQWIHNERDLWRDIVDYHFLKRPLNNRRPPPRPFQDRALPSDGFNQAFNRRPLPPRPFQDRSNQDAGFYRRPPPPRPNDRPSASRYQPKVERISDEVANFSPQILIRDEFATNVIGRANLQDRIEWVPIKVDNKHVGDLGVIYQQNVSNTVESYFVDKQKSILATMIIVMLVAAVVLAFLLSKKLMSHIQLLQLGLSQLVRGDYDKRLTVTSKDELGQLASNFNTLSQTLKNNQQSRQQWIADISHELRTPVAILKGELEALIDGVRQNDLAALQSLLQESDRLTLLINDLHELSLSDLGALRYKKETIDFVELMFDYISEQKERTDLNGLEIVFKSDVEHCLVLMDADRVEQCLNNFMQNTLRYTDLPGQLRVTLQNSDQHIIMCWEDTSPGVSVNEIDHLFDRLYRVEKSRNRVEGGAGLGLSICKNIIDAHGFDVTLFQSQLGGLGIKLMLSKAKHDG